MKPSHENFTYVMLHIGLPADKKETSYNDDPDWEG